MRWYVRGMNRRDVWMMWIQGNNEKWQRFLYDLIQSCNTEWVMLSRKERKSWKGKTPWNSRNAVTILVAEIRWDCMHNCSSSCYLPVVVHGEIQCHVWLLAVGGWPKFPKISCCYPLNVYLIQQPGREGKEMGRTRIFLNQFTEVSNLVLLSPYLSLATLSREKKKMDGTESPSVQFTRGIKLAPFL